MRFLGEQDVGDNSALLQQAFQRLGLILGLGGGATRTNGRWRLAGDQVEAALAF
jgi:hypothetical protein